MRIAIISEYNSMTTVGGTEYYVSVLAEGLASEGHELIVISSGRHNEGIREELVKSGNYWYRNILLSSIVYDVDEIRQDLVSRSWTVISDVLECFQPDLIHVHTLSTFFNIRHLELCVRRYAHIVFTSHVPGHFCAKGTLIRGGRNPCNGLIGMQCQFCMFSDGLKAGLANIIQGHVRKKLQLVGLLDSLGVHVVCVSKWQRDQLSANGFPPERLSVIRQVLKPEAFVVPEGESGSPARKDVFTVGYLGRLSPEKGSSLLLKYMREFAGSGEIRFLLGLAVNSDPVEMAALKEILARYPGSIMLRMNVSGEEKAAFFADIDCLFIPSYFPETGPIVLLEALRYHRPVVAPDVGGPVEFSNEYPGAVHCYHWNNVADADRVIRKVCNSVGTGHRTGRFTYDSQKKNRDFILDHLALYGHILSKPN